MHLMYTVGPDGKRVYTLKKVVNGEVSKSAHPARFSPDDKYSRYATYTIEGLGNRLETIANENFQTSCHVEKAIWTASNTAE